VFGVDDVAIEMVHVIGTMLTPTDRLMKTVKAAALSTCDRAFLF
jgi:hypothetical protein